MSEMQVGRGEFDALKALIESTNQAVGKLAEAVTPQEKEEAKQAVVEREMDERTMAKRLGISLEDVQRVRDENEYGKFKKMQDRLDKERADAAAEVEDEDETTDNGKTIGEKVRDGLGGIRNLDR